MNNLQKKVAIGAASGVTVMLVSLVALSGVMPALTPVAAAGERLAFTVKWIALAAAPLFLAIIMVGNERFGSDAIDPTAGKESRAMIINGRVVDNTLQQFALFAAATLAVAASSRGDQLGLLAGAALIFVAVRFAFWIGYRIQPVYRAFGFAATAYLNIVLFGIAVWRAWF